MDLNNTSPLTHKNLLKAMTKLYKLLSVVFLLGLLVAFKEYKEECDYREEVYRKTINILNKGIVEYRVQLGEAHLKIFYLQYGNTPEEIYVEKP